ncbi:unnamed protein product [Peniophora sp. CBMAI 1063]|nr:unnamed protein product [Peniophora sp. CBMAI 1063]
MFSTAQSLPHDVLSELFEHVAVIDPAGALLKGERRSLGWITTTHVCARWREVGLGLAALWADAVCAFPSVAIADEVLLRARDCLLNVTVGPPALDLDPRTPFTRAPHLPTSWGIQHLQRARTLRCHVDRGSTYSDHSEAYTALRDTTLPLLQHLYLSDTTKPKRGDPPPIVELTCPSLLSAHFCNVLPHPSFAVSASSLSRLCLELPYGTVSVYDLSPCLCALRDMSRLEHLKLVLSGGIFPRFSLGIVRFENLKTLHVSCKNAQHAPVILDFISTPCIVDTSIEITEPLHNWDEPIIFPRIFVHQPQALHTGSVSISDTSLKVESGDGPDHAMFSLTWRPWAAVRYNTNLTYSEILSAIAHQIDLSGFTSCSVWFPDPRTGGRGANVGAALAALRQALSSVKTLTLHNA